MSYFFKSGFLWSRNVQWKSIAWVMALYAPNIPFFSRLFYRQQAGRKTLSMALVPSTCFLPSNDSYVQFLEEDWQTRPFIV
jgi:hypothetical protein